MRKTSDLGGIVAMLTATGSFVVGDTLMKLVVGVLPPFETLFLRGIAASIACGITLIVSGEWRAIAGGLNRFALMRGFGETLDTVCYILALASLPIADVIAILQTAPLLLILGGAIFYGEAVGPARIALVLLGFAGAIMVAQPSSAGLSPAVLLAFGAAFAIAGRDLVGRRVPSDIPVTVIAFATLLMTLVVAGAGSMRFETWVPPSALHLLSLTISGVMLTIGHFGLLFAYRLGRTVVVAPFFYSFAVWGLLAGLVVWRVLPNPLALAGIACIVASGVAILLTGRLRSAPQAVPELP